MPRRRTPNKLNEESSPRPSCSSHNTQESYSTENVTMDYSAPTSPLFSGSEIDDEYLNSILNNYGIRMGAEGQGVVEVDAVHNPYDDSVAHITDLGGGAAVVVTSSSPASPSDVQDDYSTWSTCMSPGISSSSEEPPFPYSPGTCNFKDASNIKPRKYKISGPLEDPEEERRRRNAVIARENRLKHKKYLDELQNKKRSLEHVNAQCAKALIRVRQDIKVKDQQLQEANQQIRELKTHLMAKSEKVSNYKSQLNLIRTHLELIEASVDSSNPVRGFISTLLQRLPHIEDEPQESLPTANVYESL
ncbi:unnamed protein product [Meganyctiphanes norvegica]|uniref:BZIP domain-containing protein n=1 Tax=Meganyctiphanes norvegica TaxID=48144 RepID=A0AAV2Q262_MEGNR